MRAMLRVAVMGVKVFLEMHGMSRNGTRGGRSPRPGSGRIPAACDRP